MIVVDTNVVSELVRTDPDPTVLLWFSGLRPDELCLTATVTAEIYDGISRLPPGRRRDTLQTHVDELLGTAFGSRVLPFDHPSARVYALVVERRRRAGRPIAIADAQIAAVCLRHDATLATRNVPDFDHLGIDVVNPWTAETHT